MSEKQHPLARLVEIIAKELVDHPDDVKVEVTIGARTVALDLVTHPTDVGKILGKKGVYADAIRCLLNAAAGRWHLQAKLHIVQPDDWF